MLILRRIVQTACAVFFIVVVWTTRYPLDHFLNPAVLFKIDPLVMIMTSIAERIILPGIVFAVMTLAATFVLGRVFCGWVCPLGAVSDFWVFLTDRLRLLLRLPVKDFLMPRGRFIKYAGLGLCALLAVGGIQFVWLFDPLTIFVRSVSFGVIPPANALFESISAKLIPATNYYPPVEVAYHWLKEAMFDPRRLLFPHAPVISTIFVVILAAAVMVRRFWCRYLCPLGGMLALVAAHSLLKRVSPPCAVSCGMCKDDCRMGAIADDNSYNASECIVCLDCVKKCSGDTSSFSFDRHKIVQSAPLQSAHGISRAQFFAWSGVSLGLLASSCAKPFLRNRVRAVIRPPAALPEAEFVQRCVRCGNCMKVCITNGLQPVVLESGSEGIWTPKMDPSIGYCEYKCTLCGRVCPTGAIPPLTVEQKVRTHMGVANIARDRCIPWATGRQCLVCEEHCPIPQKAIQIREMMHLGQKVLLPFVDADACVGCTLCQHVCPVLPRKAIEVSPV